MPQLYPSLGSLKNLIDTARTVAKGVEVAEGVGKIAGAAVKTHQTLKHVQATSLTQKTNQTTIRSRVYIDTSVALDPVVERILSTAHRLYAGMILNALQLQNLVSAGRTVQDSLRTVQTGSMEAYNDLHESLETSLVALEALGDPGERRSTFGSKTVSHTPESIKPRSYDNDSKFQEEAEKRTEDIRRDRALKTEVRQRLGDPSPEDIARNDAEETRKAAASKVTVVKPASIDQVVSDTHVPVGSLLSVTLTNPIHPELSQEVLLSVIMMPFLVPYKTVPSMLTVGTKSSWAQRLIQWKTGEISFWKDLIFQVDQLRKEEANVKSDKNGVFADYLRQANRKDRSRIGNIFMGAALNETTAFSNNLANSVFIISQDAVDQAKADTGIDFKQEADRQRFFKNSYAMMVFVMDHQYNTVTLYMNGVSEVGHYTFNNFVESRGLNTRDFVGILQDLARNQTPSRF